MKIVFMLLLLLAMLASTVSALPVATDGKPAVGAKAGDAAASADEKQKPLGRDDFFWQETPSALHHAEANRRLTAGLGKCSQFAVETRAEEKKTVHDIFFKVGENISPWPIGRIELTPKEKGTLVDIGQNKQFSMGIGKFQKMWSGYLEEQYVCPPKPASHSGGMSHP